MEALFQAPCLLFINSQILFYQQSQQPLPYFSGRIFGQGKDLFWNNYPMIWCLQPVCSWISFQSRRREEGKPMIQKREETRGYKGWEAKYYETGPLHQVRNLGRITRNRPTPKSSSSWACNKIISLNKNWYFSIQFHHRTEEGLMSENVSEVFFKGLLEIFS